MCSIITSNNAHSAPIVGKQLLYSNIHCICTPKMTQCNLSILNRHLWAWTYSHLAVICWSILLHICHTDTLIFFFLRTVLIANHIHVMSKEIAPNFSASDVSNIKKFSRRKKVQLYSINCENIMLHLLMKINVMILEWSLCPRKWFNAKCCCTQKSTHFPSWGETSDVDLRCWSTLEASVYINSHCFLNRMCLKPLPSH